MAEREDQEENHPSMNDNQEPEDHSQAESDKQAEGDQQPEDTHQAADTQQPAEEPWPTNGGPLGCLLGAIAGFLVGGFLGTTILIFERPIALVLTVVLTIGLAIAGWQIGRSIFREYKPPKPPKAPSPRRAKK